MYKIVEHSDLSYSMLVGPGDFKCCLGEPEDCTWYRDGSEAVVRLNELHDFIKYWSFCTFSGVTKVCPEYKQQLLAGFEALGIKYP